MTAASSAPTRRFLALLFPRLSTDRIRRASLGRAWRTGRAARPDGARPDEAPLALFERAGNAERIAAVCERAQGAGLKVGTGLADARARFPAFAFLPADPDADRRLLEAVADWCERYTPRIGIDPPFEQLPPGLTLDIAGSEHLFGGEEGLVRDLSRRLRGQGFAVLHAVAALGPTARALALGRPGAAVEPGVEEAAVRALPVRTLRLDADLAGGLERLGLETLGHLLDLPRAALARRFGADLLARLNAAAGREAVPFASRQPVVTLRRACRFAEPVSRAEDVLAIVHRLLNRLATDLAEAGEGARELELTLTRLDNACERLDLRTAAPVRDPVRLLRLVTERLAALGDGLDAGFGYERIALAVIRTEPLDARQTDLGGEAAGDGQALSALVERLGARLGEAAVLRPAGERSRWPERARALRPDAAVAGPRTPPEPDAPPRPLRLLAQPEPVDVIFEVPDGAPVQFRWRRALHRVSRTEGPERIAPEWWRGAEEGTRDYFRIEDGEGRRFWLYRDRDRGASARWFLHGIFA